MTKHCLSIGYNGWRLGVCYFALQILQALRSFNRQNNSTKPLLVAGAVNETKMVKSALIEAKKLLDFYIESTEDLDTEQTESVKHFIKALRAGCGCDDYNGFDCGCGKRAFLCDEALKELESSTCH